MQWSEYSRMAGGLYTPEIKQTATNRSKLVVAEGLSEKNLLKMPGKLSAPVRSMENDLRRFVSGKSILNEVAPLVAAAAPAILGAGEAAVAGAGAAATGAAGAAATGAVAGETAAGVAGTAGAAAAPAETSAASLASDNVGKFASDVVSNINIGDTSQTSHPNEQEGKNED